jgi:hypothetical protein
MFKKVSTCVVLLLFVLSIAAQGCSTVIHGTHQDLTVNTTPAGAIARVESQSCLTPCTLHISRRANSVYITNNSIQKEYQLSKTTNAVEVYLGNFVLCLFWPGIIIDYKSGGAYSIDPVNMVLSKERNDKRQSATDLIDN